MKTILVSTLCLGFLLPVSAMAEEEAPVPKPRKERKGDGEGPRRPGPPMPRRQMFKKMDADKDGQISREEFFSVEPMDRVPEKRRDELFGRFDQDQDGFVTKKEIRLMRKAHDEERRKEFRELDVDQSGGLSFEEISEGNFFKKIPPERRREIFERMDRNGDGQITPEDRKKRGRRPKPETSDKPSE